MTHKKNALNRSDSRWAFLFLLPWLLSFSIFMVYPLMVAFSLSFQDVSLLSPETASFVGIGGWIRALNDGMFWKGLFNVVYNQVVFIALSFIVALLLAVMLWDLPMLSAFFRTAYFLPVIVSATVAMLIFNNITSPQGPIQSLLIQIGIMEEPVFWKNTVWLPMLFLAIFNSWKFYGTPMIILLGGLSAIDQSVIEASQVDGASWWKRLTKIQVPLLKPQIFFIITMNVINGLQMFTEPYIAFDLDGGPKGSGLTPVLYLYKTAFTDMRMGYAATLGLLLAIIILLATGIQQRVMRDRELS